MAGNTLGVRRYYKYTTDKDIVHSYLTDKDLGDAVSGELDDTSPPFRKRFKPRGVYCEAVIDGTKHRKFVVVPKTSNAVWADTSKDISIDGKTFKTTGRKGESMSFGANPADSAPPTGT